MAIKLMGVGTTALLIKIGGQDITDHVKSVTIDMSVADVDVTPMNSVSVAHAPGLRDDSIELELFQDFESNKVHALVNPLLGSQTGATILVQSSGATVNTTNPSFSMVGSPYGYQPLAGTVGDASMTTVKFMPIPGSSITVGTS